MSLIVIHNAQLSLHYVLQRFWNKTSKVVLGLPNYMYFKPLLGEYRYLRIAYRFPAVVIVKDGWNLFHEQFLLWHYIMYNEGVFQRFCIADDQLFRFYTVHVGTTRVLPDRLWIFLIWNSSICKCTAYFKYSRISRICAYISYYFCPFDTRNKRDFDKHR